MTGWEHQAEAWTAWARSHDDGWRSLAELLPPPRRAALDVGCGEGRHVRALRALGYAAVGVEPAPTLVEAARRADPDGDYRVAAADELPFAAASFGLVVSVNVLSCVDDLGAALAETARVLEPRGRLCASIPHPLHTAGRSVDGGWRIAGDYYAQAPHEERAGGVAFVNLHRPLEAYGRALEEAGFLVEALREPARPLVPVFLQLRAVRA